MLSAQSTTSFSSRQGDPVQVLIADLRDQHKSLQLYIENWGKKQEQVIQAVVSAWSKDRTVFSNHEQTHLANAQLVLSPKSQKPEKYHSDFDMDVARMNSMEAEKDSNSSRSDISEISEQFHRVKHQTTSKVLHHDQEHYNTITSKIVHSDKFEVAMGLTILLNSIVMGVSAEYDMDHIDDPREHPVLEWAERAFVVAYSIEVLLRLRVYGLLYFIGLNWKWNWLDITLVVVAIFDQLSHFFASVSQAATTRMSILRMLRLVKMVRMLRIIRLMVAFRELRLILHSMLSSMQAMFWACVLLLMVSYVVSVCFMHACISHLRDYSSSGRAADKEVRMYWGSIGSAMLSLFLSTTGGQDWEVIADPLWDVGIVVYSLFILYIAFFMFVITNTLTSIFLDTVMTSSAKDENMIVQQELEKQHVYIARLEGFFNEMDTNKTGHVSYDQFRDYADDPQWHALAASLDIDVTDAKQCFFNLAHGHGHIDLETWVVGCIKMKGFARSLDLLSLTMQHNKAVRDHKLFSQEITYKADKIEKMLGRLLMRSDGDRVSQKSHHSRQMGVQPRSPNSRGHAKRDSFSPSKVKDGPKERSGSNAWWLDLCSTPSKDARYPPETLHAHAPY